MTACGHVYCFPCVLRYLGQAVETENRGWRKCPICYDPVYPKALKPVVTYHAPPPPKPPCSLNFRLLYRRQDSTVTLPSSDGIPVGELPWDHTPGALIFTKLARSTARHLADHLKADRSALAEALFKARKEGEVEEAKFVLAAHTEVSLSLSSIPHDQPQLPSSASHASGPRELHRFYRSEDGQHIYLYPLHSRVLFDHYQEEGNVPESTTLPIIHYEETTVNEVKPYTIGPLDARARHLKAKLRAERMAELRANSKSFYSLEPLVDPIVSIGLEDFPEMPTSLPPSVSVENESSNWAAMAARSRDSHSEWTALSSEQQYLAPRAFRTLADDVELALSESMFALDTNDSKATKKGKKKLILLSSNAQRRR
ncbi:hypothetical protein L0F63_007294 [Massospora cicadina]|nr:hypothetical protein L0F63_007294 [Massospora cicadina]